MSRKVGFATAGDARGSLVFAKLRTDSFEVAVRPSGDAEADLDGHILDPEYFAQLEDRWRVKWFEEDLGERIWMAIDKETDWTAPVDRRVDSLAELTWNRLEQSGAWVLAPFTGSLVRAINSTSGERSETYSRSKRRNFRRLTRFLDPLLMQLADRGFVLAVMKRDQIPTNLWDE